MKCQVLFSRSRTSRDLMKMFVISSLRQLNPDVIGITTVCPDMLGRHVYIVKIYDLLLNKSLLALIYFLMLSMLCKIFSR